MGKKEKRSLKPKDPDAIIEYLFVEKELDLNVPVKYNVGSFYNEINLYFTGKPKHMDLSTFINVFHEEFEKRTKELTYFRGKKIDLSEYKFGIVDDKKKITVFDALDESFFKAVIATPRFVIIGKDFDLNRFKTHEIFDDFYRYVHRLFDEEKILENYVEPDAAVEYLFVEKADWQKKVINDNQGYIMAAIYLNFDGEFANANLPAFKALLQEELNFSLQDSDYFTEKSVDFADYKFYLIDNDKKATDFAVMDDVFFDALMASLRNLVIVGKNFDLEAFKEHSIFREWFDKWSNKI